VDDGDDSWAASSASLWVLFFVVLVFMLLVGDDLILQVTGVFTSIHPGATLAADCGGAYRSNLLHGGDGSSRRAAEGHMCRSIRCLQLRGMKNPKGLNAYYKLSGGDTLIEWISARRVTQRQQPVYSTSST
jgi:hypothetical protein